MGCREESLKTHRSVEGLVWRNQRELAGGGQAVLIACFSDKYHAVPSFIFVE